MSSLTNMFIADGYQSLIHANGVALTDQLVYLYDGIGNKSSLSIAKDGHGATVTGTLVADGVGYPAATAGITGDILQLDSTKNLNFISHLPVSSLTTLNPNPVGSYNLAKLENISINEKGLVTALSVDTTSRKTFRSTTYVGSAANSPFIETELGTTWTQITIPGGYNLPLDTVSVTLFIRDIAPSPTTNENRKENETYLIESSPVNGDNSYILPMTYFQIANKTDGTLNAGGMGAQCNAIVAQSGNSLIFHLRDIGSAHGREAYPVKWSIHLIAFQR